MSFPHYDLVVRAQNDLINEGLIKVRADHDQVEQDKGLLTRRAGYYVNQQEDPKIGLLAKTTGNNSLGYSVDILIHLDGTFWDVATDKNGLATPVDGGPNGPDPELAKDWKLPTAELAQISNSTETGTDLSNLAPPYDENKSVEFGLACNDVYNECKASIDPGMISVHSQRAAYDYYVKGMPWPDCMKKHINEFRAVYSLAPI